MLRNACIPRDPKQGKRMRSGCLTPAFSGAHKRTEFLRNFAFFGAQKRAEMLRNPCLRGGPQQRGQNQNWLPHPILMAGP